MKPKIIEKIINEVGSAIDQLEEDELTLIKGFNLINEIVAKYHKKHGLETVMNITYANSYPVCGVCLVTDYEPGAILFQSDDNFLPKVRIVFPEDMADFTEAYEPWFAPEYPEIPDEEEDDDEDPYDLDLSEEEQEEMWDNFD